MNSHHSPKICDHTSVGMLVWKEGKLLLIERGQLPWGFSVPAGHVDDDATYEESARRELFEEVGLTAVTLKLEIEGKKENRCKRLEGTWHYWKLYTVEVTGDLNRSLEETKHVGWYTKEEIAELAKKTEAYKEGKITEDEWEQAPGLVPIMYEWFKELKII